MLILPPRSPVARFVLAFLCQAGIGLAATPPDSPRQASSSRGPALSASPVAYAVRAAMEAYRADFADMNTPVFLGLEEAQILADHLEIGVEVFQVQPDSQRAGQCPEIQHIATLNADDLEDDALYSLLFHNRHFAVIAPREEQEVAEYTLWVGGQPEQFIEVGEIQAVGYRHVPSDGHCLITALFFIAYDCFPNAEEVAELRALVATRLTDEQVTRNLKEMVEDLILNAAERPWENGRFASYGPRTSAMVATDPHLMAARERQLEPHRQQLAALTAAHAQDQEELEEQAELAAAIALSMTLAVDAPAPAGVALASLAPGAPALDPLAAADGDPEERQAKKARFAE